ncbi:MAG TPA: MoxR family ATPase [Candidatus Limnocylindria bacterium]|nr:MoxR family ATPase [Candidatus Limnocylindria bacterium]
MSRFASAEDVVSRLRSERYLADDRIGLTVFLADRLEKPVLLEGPAGVGKTELARSVAAISGARLIRLQCYEGLDDSKALYEWNYKKQLLRIQADERHESWSELEEDIFSESFLLARPLLAAIRAQEPVVLLIDEVDRVEVEAEALMLEVLSDFQITIPELGTISANRIPMVFLTSNDTRDLSEALKRRCLFLHIDYPPLERERDILLARVDGLSVGLADQLAALIRSVRALDLKKRPSISESIDWARTMVILGAENVDAQGATETLHVLLKYEADIDKARRQLHGQAQLQESARAPHVDSFRSPQRTAE